MERNNIRNFEKQHQVIHWRSPNVLFAKSLRLVSAVQNTFSLLKPSYIRWRCEYCKFEHTNSLFITSSLWYIIPYIYKYFVQYIVLLYFLIPLQYCILTVYLNKYLNFVLIEDFFFYFIYFNLFNISSVYNTNNNSEIDFFNDFKRISP